jgi:hypothetical protein
MPDPREIAHEIKAQLEMAALALANPLFFALRGMLRFRRAGYAESSAEGHALVPPELKRALASDRARALETRYRIAPTVQQRLSPASLLQVLYFMDLLDTALERAGFAGASLARLEGDSFAPIDTLDIGAKNFISSIALWHVLEPPPAHATPAPRGALLTGVEIDGWRILRGWHSRCDMANYYLGLLPASESARKHTFQTLDFLQLSGQFDFITWFHPFLDAYPLLHWGLPRRLLRPEPMFRHMLARLRPGGVALVVNQEPHENIEQMRLIAAAGPAIAQHAAFEHASPFAPQQALRYLHVLHKRA